MLLNFSNVRIQGALVSFKDWSSLVQGFFGPQEIGSNSWSEGKSPRTQRKIINIYHMQEIKNKSKAGRH